MKLLILVVALCCTIHQGDAYLKLMANLAESNGFPITLHCPQTLGYVLVGGITVNHTPLEDKLQKKVEKQCEKEMKKYENAKNNNNVNNDAPSGEGTSCTLSLKNNDVGEDDIVRVVFSCHDATPTEEQKIIGEEVIVLNGGGNGGGNGGRVPESKEETIPKDNIATLNCEKKKEVITIEEVLLGGNVPQTHPDLVPQKMTDECYAQWVNELNNGRSKKHYPICQFTNSYDQELKIKYVCLGPGDVRKEKGNKDNGNGNGGNGNGGNGNNGNGNGGNGNNGNGNGGNGNNGNGNNGNGGKSGGVGL